MKKKGLFAFLVIAVAAVVAALLLGRCEKRDLSAEASQAAVDSYRLLLSGDYDGYVSNVLGSDRMHPDYRSQMVVAYKQFIGQQKDEHGGIMSVKPVNARLESEKDSLVNVFMMLCFADSTNEEIVVPMVCRHGRWQMR